VADPFGSWVQGAHEGLQDAAAMREAQDRAARNAFDLNRDATMNPYHLEVLRSEAGLKGLDLAESQQLYNAGIPLDMARARLEAERLHNTEFPSSMGDYGPYYQYQTQHGGGQFTPQGVQYPIRDSQGNQQYYETPYGNVRSPAQLNPYYRGLYNQERIDLGEEGRDIQRRRLEDQEGSGTYGAGISYGYHPSHSIFGNNGLGGNNPPAAHVTADSSLYPNTPIDLRRPGP
jgi:hypothetical protein